MEIGTAIFSSSLTVSLAYLVTTLIAAGRLGALPDALSKVKLQLTELDTIRRENNKLREAIASVQEALDESAKNERKLIEMFDELSRKRIESDLKRAEIIKRVVDHLRDLERAFRQPDLQQADKLIYEKAFKDARQLFEGMGLRVLVPTQKDRVDERQHDVREHVECAEVEEGHIVEAVSYGYFWDEILRERAKVVIARKMETKETQVEMPTTNINTNASFTEKEIEDAPEKNEASDSLPQEKLSGQNE